MNCVKCDANIDDDSLFCKLCGKKQIVSHKKGKTKSKGNGQGTVYKTPSGTWCAEITMGYKVTPDGKKRRVKKTKSGFDTKTAALNYIPKLRTNAKIADTKITFKGLYDLWQPTHENDISKSTLNCYKAALKYYQPIWFLRFSDIGIDDLQECISECDKGKQTRRNMRTLGTLLYKYALPRGYVPTNLNYAEYLKVGDGETGTRNAFDTNHIKTIKNHIGVVAYADIIYCMIYTGYRPQEFLDLEIEKYDFENNCFIGGGKTDAGTDRLVTVSPKIKSIVKQYTDGKTLGAIFTDENGCALTLEKFRICFYEALEQMGIDNPIDEKSKVHKYTPYSCRHTFATLMKRVVAPDKDKLELMGHTSTEMLQHYQHLNYDDLRKITDNI